ncbi:hypothetical protein [Nonomuraea sp. NPDC046570]|uniref:hypothetical protein n=1 Tax=Nonomuraea sp. NPDC046570 TaxID=3155255 RepID=UPI0033D4D04B
MSAAHEEYEDLHRLIDRLTSTQVRALRAVALELVDDRTDPEALETGRQRTLSFAGLISDEPDAAQRSEEIIRDLSRQS